MKKKKKGAKSKDMDAKGMNAILGVTSKKPEPDTKVRSPGTVKAMNLARDKRLKNVLI